MEISNALLITDRNRIFDDWGESVLVRKVTQTFTPETQQLAESVIETALTGIVGVSPSTAIPDTRGQSQTVDLIVRVKLEEFPGDPGDFSYRLVSNDTEYDILSQVQPAGLAVLDLACRKVA